MIPFLIFEISIILSGFAIFSGHAGISGKILNVSFFLLFFAIFLYIIRLVDKKESN